LDRIVEFLLPVRCRYFIGWFITGVAVYWSVYVFNAASWPFWVEVISPGASTDPTLSGPFQIVGIVIGAGIVFVLTGLLRLRGAPRWLWIPIGATAVWYTALTLWSIVPSLGSDIGSLSSPGALGIATAILPLFSELATALAACIMFAGASGSLFGDPDERWWLGWTTALAVVTTAISQTGVLTGLLGDDVIGWNLIVPGALCLLGTGVLRLPRGIWLAVSETSLPIFLMWLTPAFLVNAVSGTDVRSLVGWELLFVGLSAVSAIAGSVIGASLRSATRSRLQHGASDPSS
jgi:hypothetical protein